MAMLYQDLFTTVILTWIRMRNKENFSLAILHSSISMTEINQASYNIALFP